MRTFSVLMTILIGSSQVGASSPEGLTFQGRIIKPNGNHLEATSVLLNVKILSPSDDCVLLEENHTVPMNDTAGVFSVVIGAGLRTGADKGFNLLQVFKNSGSLTGLTCMTSGATQYNAQSGHSRRVRITFNDGTETVTLSSDFIVRSVPYATIADSIQGKGPSDFVQVNTEGTKVLSQANLEQIFDGSSFTELAALIAGTSSQYAKSTALPVSGGSLNMSSAGRDILVRDTPTSGDSAVNKDYVDAAIAGAAPGAHTHDAADIASGVLNAARIPTGTDSTKLPLAGGTLTGALTMSGQNILATGHITMSPEMTINLGTYDNTQEDALDDGLGLADKGKFWYNTSSNQLKFWNGTAVVALGSAGSGIQSFNGATGNNQTLQLGTAGNAPAISAAGDVHTLNIPEASNTAKGVMSTGAGLTAASGVVAPDFGSGLGKVTQGNDDRLNPAPVIGDALSFIRMNAGGTAYEVRTPVQVKSDLGLGTMATATATDYLDKAGNLSGLANAGTARTNLGLGSMSTETATDYLSKAGNLSGLANAGTARTNLGSTATGDALFTAANAGAGRTALGLGTMATATATDYLDKAGNLSGLANAGTARTNLGLGTISTEAAADYLSKAGNLSGLADAAASRTNLGLGTMAVETASNYVQTSRTVSAGTGLTGGGDLSANRSIAADFGTGAGKVTEGNDARLSPTPILADAGKMVRVNAGGTGYEVVAPGGGGDFMKDGSVTMTGNIKLGGKFLSNDGHDEGVSVANDGKVGVGINNQSALLQVGKSSNDASGIPTTIESAYYLGLGGREYEDNSYRLIGYGYKGTGSTHFPAYSGFQEMNTSGATYGDLVFGTRPNDSDVAPSERLRITSAGNVGIGNISPAATAILDITSTTKGLLIPRMTEAQRDAISSPATGLQVYNTDDNRINFYNGSAWTELSTGSGYVVDSRTITPGTGLTGGGDLTANRSLAVDFGTGAGKVVQGNDNRLAPAPTGLGGQFVRVNAGATAYETVALGTMATATATDYLDKAGNLSGLVNAGTARANLGLGTAATAASTDFIAAVAPGTSGNVLTSNGTIWTSSALPVATAAVKGIMETGAGLVVSSGEVTPDFGSGIGKVVQGNDDRLNPAPVIGDALKIPRINSGGTAYEVVTAGTILSSGGAVVNGGNTLAATLTIGTNDAQSLAFETNNATAITILNGGNVGIGTTNPSDNLQVVGTDNDIAQFKSSATDFSRIGVNVPTDSDAQISFQENDTTKWSIGNDGSDSDKFKIRTGFGAFGTAADKFTIDASGNIGVGTTSPAAKLDISSGGNPALLVGADDSATTRTDATNKTARIG
ncbi:MAG: beta strand repeat-containing protein, partial [Pseudobdellovibrionaceae bacterium]